MEKLSIKERVFYSLLCNEERVYRNWYRRYLNAGVDLDRIRSVVARIKNWYEWCSEWSREGEWLENLAEEALSKGNTYSARVFFHEAAGCFHVGQHFFYIDPDQKTRAEERLRTNYKSAIALYDEAERPMRIEIPCAIGSGGPAHARNLSNKMKVNPILLKGIPHLVGAETYEESLELFDIDIGTAPPMDRPLLIFHSGKDKLIPDGEDHADYFMEWAVGEKELKYYPEGMHVCANYLDETDAYMVDWLNKHLLN